MSPGPNDELKLLIEWSSPWQEFVTALRPALAKSQKPLAGEARTNIFPYRGILFAWILETALLIAVIVIPAHIAFLRPYEPPQMPKYDVIYFSGDELPQTEDLGGAKAGQSGRAGGKSAFHRTQVIHVSRGDSLREQVVDAPKLDLPQTDSAVKNLLAYKAVPGPAPAEGLKPSMKTPVLEQNAAGPAPDIDRQKLRAAPAMNAMVVPPSPSGMQRLPEVHVPGSQMVQVIPPPVSAPEQITNSQAKLTLPANLVAPPPVQITSAGVSKGPGFGSGDWQRQIVPPPVQVGSSGNGHAMGGMGTANVVAPPVAISGAPTGNSMIASLGRPGVVPPPVQIGGGGNSLGGHGLSGMGGGGSSVVPPPADISGTGSLSGHGHGNRGNGFGSPLDAGSVAAPPSGTGGNAAGNGIVVSSRPGSKVGVPGGGGAGSLALSPAGGLKPGYGGPGTGTGIAQGEGPGAGISGEGSGSSNTGNGPGADLNARNGISPYPGPGGAGTGERQQAGNARRLGARRQQCDYASKLFRR